MKSKNCPLSSVPKSVPLIVPYLSPKKVIINIEADIVISYLHKWNHFINALHLVFYRVVYLGYIPKYT